MKNYFPHKVIVGVALPYVVRSFRRICQSTFVMPSVGGYN